VTIFVRCKLHCRNISNAVIYIVGYKAWNKVNGNNTVSILECVDENLSEGEYSDSHNETDDN
jgi:hypothetical protein